MPLVGNINLKFKIKLIIINLKPWSDLLSWCHSVPPPHPPKQAYPSVSRGYSVWPGASWGCSWTEKPKADTEAVRHARKRHVSKVKLTLYSAQICPWRLLAARSSQQAALPHGSGPGWYTSNLKLCEINHTICMASCGRGLGTWGFLLSLQMLRKTEWSTGPSSPVILNTRDSLNSGSVEPRIQRRDLVLHTHLQ